ASAASRISPTSIAVSAGLRATERTPISWKASGHQRMSTSLGSAYATMSPAPMPWARSACTRWWARPASPPQVSVVPDGEATTAGRSGWSWAIHQTPRRWLYRVPIGERVYPYWDGSARPDRTDVGLRRRRHRHRLAHRLVA